MDQPYPKIAPASLLHRILRFAPGRVPAWLCSRDYCTGFDLIIASQITLLTGAFVASKVLHLPWLWIPALVVLGSFAWFVYLPFEQRERWGRARLRRGECVWCGESGVASGAECQACRRAA